MMESGSRVSKQEPGSWKSHFEKEIAFLAQWDEMFAMQVQGIQGWKKGKGVEKTSNTPRNIHMLSPMNVERPHYHNITDQHSGGYFCTFAMFLFTFLLFWLDK